MNSFLLLELEVLFISFISSGVQFIKICRNIENHGKFSNIGKMIKISRNLLFPSSLESCDLKKNHVMWQHCLLSVININLP